MSTEAIRPFTLTSDEWVERCKARIVALDHSLRSAEVADLARALQDRQSCRAMWPERAADLLFEDKLTSKWSARGFARQLDEDV